VSSNSNQRKDALLGEPHGTASARLRKSLLFKYVRLAGHDKCYRCGNHIARVEDFSIEHTEAWQSATAPRDVFFDLEKIAFSHLRCNVDAGNKSQFISRNTGKTHCDHGHELNQENTLFEESGRRQCRSCKRERMRRYRGVDPKYGRGALEREG
jgi:hypothetical protein